MTTETKVAAKAAGKRAISKMRLLGRVTCPHCWNQYAPENSLWISSDHDSLRDDTKIRGEPRRFPAERFHVSGDAIDARGERCAALACPNCHLVVPRVSYEFQPFFASIVGGPGCGKSFFLPAMTWTLRTTLPRQFATEFLDADPVFNLKLHEYERSLFLNPKRDEVVTIEKTMATAGQEGLYDQVVLGGKTVAFARPFLFRLQPNDHHPEANNREQSARTVCLYDNAGELYLPSFQPGDTSRATDHLGHTHLTMFLFDPTQDMRFRDACKGKSRDPQMQIRDQEFTREAAVLQHTILLTAAARMKRLRGLAESERHDGPLVVILTKLDAWSALIPNSEELLRTKYMRPLSRHGASGETLHAYLPGAVKQVSNVVRSVLLTHAPEIVSAAEGYSSNVTYVACSATGRNVQAFEGGVGAENAFGIRPRDVKPFWCDLPFLIGLHQNGLSSLPLASS
jgi:hypothetical protein